MQKTSIFDRIKAFFGQKSTPPKNTTKQSPREMYVFLTVKGKKFHYTPHCSALRNAKTVRMDLSKAKKAGYTACDKCCYSYLHD